MMQKIFVYTIGIASLYCYVAAQAGYDIPPQKALFQDGYIIPDLSQPAVVPAPNNGFEITAPPVPVKSNGDNGYKTGDQLIRQPAHGSRIKFPLPSCYINADGFMCCNKKLERVMNNAYKKLSSRPNWKKCNIAQISTAVQSAAESKFKTPFEAIAGTGDFASKNYFSQDLICKIKRDSSYILALATPQDL